MAGIWHGYESVGITDIPYTTLVLSAREPAASIRTHHASATLKLKRDVTIKVLPEGFSQDRDRCSSVRTRIEICLALSYSADMNTSEIARLLGRRGGLKRAQRLSNARRVETAQLGSQARTDSFRLGRAIRNNFDYVAAMHQLNPPARVNSESKSARKLPGIYDTTQRTQK